MSTRSPFKRRAACLLTVGAMSLSLAACGGTDDQQSSGSDNAGSKNECDKSEDFPKRQIEFIVPWAAGGGTDTVSRFVAAELAKAMETKINVVNRTGGAGVVGHTAISKGKADGSVIGLATVELAMMHWQGVTKLNHKDLTPVGLVNFDPAAITVKANAPYKDFKQFVAYVKANPGKVTATGTGAGGIWDLARAGMLLELGLPANAIRWVPSEGAAPGLQEVVAGGVTSSFASLPENQTMIKNKQVRALAIMGDKKSDLFPNVPTAKSQGTNFTTGAWRGIMGPKGMDAKIVEELECHLQKVVNGPEYANFLKKTGYGKDWKPAAEFATFLAKEDADKGAVMKKTGLAK